MAGVRRLVLLAILLVVVGCGGGIEQAASSPVPTIDTSLPTTSKKATTVSDGNVAIVHMYQALYGVPPSFALLQSHTTQANTDVPALAKYLANSFASTSNAALARLVLDNLGVNSSTVTAINAHGQSEYAILRNALEQLFAFYGADARGQIILNATNLLVDLEKDVTYGLAAIAYNKQASANLASSSNSVAAVAPRPGFVKGVFTMDVGGWMPGTYARGLFEPTYDRILSQVGGNLVAISDPVFVTDFDAIKGLVTMSTSERPAGAWTMLTRGQYTKLVASAHGRGIAFMLQLGLYPSMSLSSKYFSEIFGIADTNETFWDAWFAAYEPIALEYAAIARDLNIEYLSLGMNHGFMTRLPVKRWSGLVAAIRNVGYSGKLVYQARVGFQNSTGEFLDFNGGWIGTESERQAKRLEFVKLFDAIILNVYSIARDRTSPRSISRDEMKQSFRWLLSQVNGYPVPFMVMVGTPSVYGGAVDPEYIEPCLVCNSVAQDRQRDDMQQADVYEALAEVVNETPTGIGNVMGVLSWGYWFTDDYYSWTNEWGQTADMAYDKSANVRGKLAEIVLKWWFDRW